ncbi:SDR family oxidoreductase [Lentisphaera marina]|uniref:NAD-dependent epimerase/dehydratase family protein n=1 Tax=Lentisphaera marina TaxID=1111041 RepID=UPI0023658402|nr:SDR family oxidoreductase [Lentisphaera marina]MDD7985721.1 SDR family oxidoreductase [Lentisphaera marina]
MKILVTGGCGYIGSVLVPKLLDQGHEVIVVDIMWFGNVLQKHDKLNVIEMDVQDVDNLPMTGVDVIINLANIANDPCGDLNSKLSWEVNVLTAMKMTERAIELGVKQILHSSSGSVYGLKEEDQVTEDLSLVPLSDYNKTKMIAERVFMSYQDQITVHMIRPATVCGYSPRTRLDVAVNMLTMQACVNQRITVFGGDQTRPNIHIQDITDVFIYFLGKGPETAGVYNAGFENISILEIAERANEKIPSEIVVTESNDPRSYRLNSDKLLATGFKPKYNVAYAIEEIIEAYQSGKLIDNDNCYNIRTMKKLNI